MPETKGPSRYLGAGLIGGDDVDTGIVATDFPAYILNPPPTAATPSCSSGRACPARSAGGQWRTPARYVSMYFYGILCDNPNDLSIQSKRVIRQATKKTHSFCHFCGSFVIFCGCNLLFAILLIIIRH